MDRRWRCGRWILGSAALVAVAASHALGLGDAQLLSHLNEPLEVRIPLRLAPGERLDQTRVTLASERAFTMLNIPQTALAYQLRFEVVQGPSPYILIRAPTVVQDPIVQFPIQVTSEEGSSFIRGYTLFLKSKGLDEGAALVGGAAGNRKMAPLPFQSPIEQGDKKQQKPSGSQGVALPPRAKTPSAPVDQSLQQATRQGAGHKEAEPAARQEAWPDASLPPPIRTTALPQPQQEKRAPPAAPHATARESIHQGPSAVQRQDSKQTAAEGLPDRYGPVRSGETLFQVARAIQPHFDDISAARLAAALYQKNPRAFLRGAPGLLMKGSYLRIPDKHEVAAMQPAQASAILRGRYARAQNRTAENQTAAVAVRGQAAEQSPPVVRHGTETALNNDSGAEESATQGRSPAPVTLTPAGQTAHVAGTRSQSGEPVAGSQQQASTTASSTSSTGAAPQAPVKTSAQMGQPEVLLAQQPGSSTGSSGSAMSTAPDPGSTGHESPQQSGGAGHAGPSAAPESAAAPAALPDHQSQRAKAPVMPPPAQHQEGLHGQRSQVPWFVKLAVGIVGIACVLVGLIVFLSRRQRAEAQKRRAETQRAEKVPVGQASRDLEKPLPGLDAADSDPGSAQAMQQASELMACGLYQDAQTILEKALVADSGNQRLRLKYLEATAALGQFDKVSEQAQLMAGFELEPQVRAAVERLMQALPQSDSSTSFSKNQDHEQEFAPGNQPADPVTPMKPAASATDTWSASGLTQSDQGHVAPEQGGSPGVSVSTGKDAVADDSDFARWLTEKPDDPLLGEPSGNTGLQSVMSPDETTHESHAAGAGHVDWGFSGIQEAAPWDEELEQKPAWAAPEQASLGQLDPGTGAGPAPRENDQGIEQFDYWPAPSGQNQTALMDEARHASSAVEPAGLQEPGALSDDGFQEKHVPTPLPMDQRSTTVHAPDRPSVLAKPWQQYPALAEHASAPPALPSFNAPQPGASEMSMDEGGPQGDLLREPAAPSPRSEPSAATVDWQPPIPSATDQVGDFSMAMPAESTTPPMPSYEWSSPSASSMDQPDTREQASGHAVMHEQVWHDGQPGGSGGDGQPEHDHYVTPHDAGTPADPLSGNTAGALADSASSQDSGHEQERQAWEAQGNWSQPNQDILEREATPSEGGQVMEWSAPQDQRPQTPGQAPGEERRQVADSGLRLEQAWEERHDALPLPSTEPSGWENENVGSAFAHDERKPQGDFLLEAAQMSHPAQGVSAHEAASWPDELAQDASSHAVVDDLSPEWPAAVPGTEPSADGWLEPALGHAPGSLQQPDEPPQPSGVSDQATQTIEQAGETQAIPKGRSDDAEGSRLFERITRLARHREYT